MGISLLNAPGSSNTSSHTIFSELISIVSPDSINNMTYIPTYTGTYIFSYELVDTDNQITANLGISPNDASIFNGGTLRLGNLDNEIKSYQEEVTLTAGVTYYIFSFVGGGTSFGRMRVNITPKTFTTID